MNLIQNVIKKRLGFNTPTILMGDSAIYEEGEDADEFFERNLPKLLSNLPCGGMKDGTSFTVEDFTQDMEIDIIIQHRNKDEWDEKKEPDLFIIGGKAPAPKQTEASTHEQSQDKEAEVGAAADDDDDNIEVLDEEDVIAIAPAAVVTEQEQSNKKKRAAEDEPQDDAVTLATKKAKTSNVDDDVVVVLD
mmetsp:Transcript_6806/g.10100  ORF Transcript_6806/g.10100 Transcript_6806/m.10100 type:complete len:190 (-) Transcript_6806:58-627(-)